MTSLQDFAEVVIGVDTHVHSHSAAAVDARTGGVLAELTVPATPGGYQSLVDFADEHAGLRAKMQALALSDPLTGLVTRRVFEEELPRELARARRSESPLSVAVIDLDHMSAFNMMRGEREGDRLVKETASRWRGELREVDLLARLEGVEFAIVLPSCGLGEAVEVVDRVRGATPRDQTASAGVARWDGEEAGDTLLARAQDALVAAKSAGRDVTIAAD